MINLALPKLSVPRFGSCMRLWGVSVPESERLAYRIHLVWTQIRSFTMLVLYGMAHNDLQRANSRNCSTDPDEQYFIDELQAHLLEEANGASKFKERLSKSEIPPDLP